MCYGVEDTIYSVARNVIGINRMWRRWLVILMMTLVVGVRSWDCVCDPSECEALEPSGCPGLGIVVWDPCGCCKVCARTLGEDCGGFRGTCEPDLKCYEGSCTPIT